MVVVHFSITPLAGAPYLLVSALQRHTSITARLIDLKRWDRFRHDIVFEEHPEEAYELAKKANVIHLHNYLDYESRDFWPIDFRELHGRGVTFVRHFHSVPAAVARKMRKDEEAVVKDCIPSVVIGQYPEVYYPNARVVPNLLPICTDLYMPGSHDLNDVDVIFTPSNNASAWDKRWGTKGAPETAKMLTRLREFCGASVSVVSGEPHDHVLSRKRRARVVIDELITGSYHLSGLEGCSQGKPVLSFLSSRTEMVMKELAGTRSVPFVNVRLEEAFEVLVHLVRDKALAQEIGGNAREWMERYWAEQYLIHHFVQLYYDLLSSPHKVMRQEELRIEGDTARFFSVVLPDLMYRARMKHYKSDITLIERGFLKIKKLFGLIKRVSKKLISGFLSTIG